MLSLFFYAFASVVLFFAKHPSALDYEPEYEEDGIDDDFQNDFAAAKPLRIQ